VKKNLKVTIFTVGLLAVLSACTSGSDNSASETSAVSVALVMSGSITDGGWNQSAYLGLEELKSEGFDTKYSENVPQADTSSAVEGYAKDGIDLIIGHGYEFGSVVSELAPKYPDSKFFATTFNPDASIKIPSNLAFVDVQYYKASFTTGVLAAMMSTSGKVGVVGGGDNPTQAAMIVAFKAGAASVNGAVALGVLTGDYNDPQKGKEAALAMIGQGADVIAHFADTTGLGAIEAAISKGSKVIGFYNDQSTAAPDLMGTSVKIELAKMVAFLGNSVKDSSYPGGTEWAPEYSFMWNFVMGDSDHNSKVISDDIWKSFLVISGKVNTGEIVVPTS